MCLVYWWAKLAAHKTHATWHVPTRSPPNERLESRAWSQKDPITTELEQNWRKCRRLGEETNNERITRE